jgi:predicted permease
MLGGPVRGFMIGILLMALLVLLAVCVNLGALFAARTADRARELAIRIAIGSSRARVFRQLLTESVCIAIIGGVGAMTAARAILHMLSLWHPPTDFPLQVLVEPGPLVFVVAALVSLATGVIFGSIPARQIWKTDPNQAIKNAGATAALGRRITLRDVLLGVQIALCCLLVTASFVSLRGLVRAFTMPLGFQPQGVTLASFDVHLADYQASEVPAIQQRILDEASRIPGVIFAAYSSTTPLSLDQSNTSIFPKGTTDFSASNAAFESPYYNVSPGYFGTTGTRLLRGRDFSPHDTEKSPTVAIVNQTFARRLFGTEQAVGRRCPGYAGRGVEVVGVVEDGKYHSLTESPSPAIFYSINQNPSTSTVLIVRSDLPPATIIPALRQVIARVDAGLPVFSVSSWQDALALMQFPARAATIALGVLGALAMCISVTGIFGLASYSVARRLRELGIRSALGAPSARILSAALGRTFVLLSAGSLAGLTLGLGTGHLLASVVYQATASDPLVLVGAALTMALVGFMSAALPARRALAVHPAVLLRDE